MKIVFDNGKITEKITAEDKERYPNKSADKVVSDKMFILHLADPRHKGGEGSNNRNKSSKDNRFPAVFFIEIMSAVKMFLFKKA